MLRILSVAVLLAWAIPTMGQPSDSDDVQLMPGIDQETLKRLSAQLQKGQQQSDTIEKFSQLWNDRDGEGIKELYDDIQSTPEGRRMLQDIIKQKQQDPETVAKLKQMVEANRERFEGGQGRFPSRPPAEMQMPNRPRRNRDSPNRPRFPNDRPPNIDLQDDTGGGDIANENGTSETSPFSLPQADRSESSPGSPAPNTNKAKQVQAVTRFVEKNFGSLDNSPAMRGLIRDIFMSKKLDPSGDGFDNLTQGNTGNLFEDVSLDLGKVDFNFGGIDFGSLNFGGFDGSSSSSRSSSSSSGWSSPSASSFLGGDSWWSVGIFMGVLVAALLLWWTWPMLKGEGRRNLGPKPLAGQGPWPIDPRDIHDRPTLVKAFDYIATSLYGDDASAWNHQTIALKIRQTYAHADINSEQLGTIYAEARYRPIDEELAQGAISSARASLCKLAGVPA